MNETQKALIDSIRSHPLIGHGSCSVIDECWTDEEILVDGMTLDEALILHEVWADRVADAENSAF